LAKYNNNCLGCSYLARYVRDKRNTLHNYYCRKFEESLKTDNRELPAMIEMNCWEI